MKVPAGHAESEDTGGTEGSGLALLGNLISRGGHSTTWHYAYTWIINKGGRWQTAHSFSFGRLKRPSYQCHVGVTSLYLGYKARSLNVTQVNSNGLNWAHLATLIGYQLQLSHIGAISLTNWRITFEPTITPTHQHWVEWILLLYVTSTAKLQNLHNRETPAGSRCDCLGSQDGRVEMCLKTIQH